MRRNEGSDRVGRCEMCGMQMLVHRSDCKTCSAKCRKRLQRKSQIDKKRGEPMMTIGGVRYPARLVAMFSDDEFFTATGTHKAKAKKK